VASIDN